MKNTISHDPSSSAADRFRQQAEGHSGGALSDFWYFLRRTRKWWLTPIIISLLLLGALVILAGTGAAPFIYTLF